MLLTLCIHTFKSILLQENSCANYYKTASELVPTLYILPQLILEFLLCMFFSRGMTLEGGYQ